MPTPELAARLAIPALLAVSALYVATAVLIDRIRSAKNPNGERTTWRERTIREQAAHKAQQFNQPPDWR